MGFIGDVASRAMNRPLKPSNLPGATFGATMPLIKRYLQPWSCRTYKQSANKASSTSIMSEIFALTKVVSQERIIMQYLKSGKVKKASICAGHIFMLACIPFVILQNKLT